MSFLDGFKKVLMKFKKTPPVEDKTGAAPLVHTKPAVGEVVRPDPAPKSPTVEQKTSVATKPVKVHSYNWVLLLIALILTVIALLIYTGRGKPPQSGNPPVKEVPSESLAPQGILPEGDGGEFEPFEDDMPVPTTISKEKGVPAEIQVSEKKINLSADSLLDMPLKKKIFISCAKGRLKLLSMSLEPSVKGVFLDSKKCEEVGVLKEKIDTCTLTLSWDYSAAESFSKKTDIIIEWEDLSSLESDVYEEVLPVSLTYSAPVMKKAAVKKIEEPIIDDMPSKPLFEEKKPSAPKAKVEPKAEKSLFNFDSLFSFGDSDEDVKPAPKQSKKKRPGRRNLNCRKYASKAYSKDGDFVGWIRPNGEVYSPRCSKKIGKRNADGEVRSLDGAFLGYDSSFYLEKLRAKHKHDTTMEMPEHLVDFEDMAKPVSTDWTSVGKNRSSARGAISKSKPKKTGVTWDRHQMQDHMGILRSAKMDKIPFTIKKAHQVSTLPKDEEYVIRRNKPIPATIAYPLQKDSAGGVIPATAVVERNIYGGSGRTVVIPAGSLILGHVTGSWPNTYTRFARVSLQWDRLVRPDGAEFIFSGDKPISGDAQGKLGVPGKGSTDYLEQFVKPMITSIVPAAINLISPTAEVYTRKLLTDNDGDLNILETGESTSKEKAKQEMIATWNKIAHKLVGDTLQNTVPPFVVPAGTRITIYPKNDIMLRFVDDDSLFGSGARDLADEVNAGSSKEAGPVNTVQINPKEIQGVVSQMGAAQEKRNAEEAAEVAAWAEANKQEDYTVENNDPLAVFDEEVAVGKLADGNEVYEDADGYLYAYDESDTDFDVDEKDVEFYD